MPEFKDYAEKTAIDDDDISTLQESKTNITKKFSFLKLWNFVLSGLKGKTIDSLNTTQKNIVGAINEVVSQAKTNASRIDTLAKLQDGSTTGDAELQDIRVGADGTKYNTAGEAVRKQIQAAEAKIVPVDDSLQESGKAADAKIVGENIGSLKEDLGKIATTTIGNNLFNKDSADNVLGAYVNGSGVVIPNGGSMNISHLFSVDGTKELKSTSDLNANIYCYSDSSYLGYVANVNKSNPKDLKDGTTKVRISYYNTMVATLMFYQSDSTLPFEPYKEYTTIICDIDVDTTLTEKEKPADGYIVGLTFNEKEFDKIDVTDYMLFNPEIYENKIYNNKVLVDDIINKRNTTAFMRIDKTKNLKLLTNGNGIIHFFDKHGTYISYSTQNLDTVLLAADIPENAYYFACTYYRSTVVGSKLKIVTNGHTLVTNKIDTMTIKYKNVRPIVNIYLDDTEEEIFLKMADARFTGDCDVYFEKGTYNFSSIFELMKTKYGFVTAYELPIGGNCRYFFNGSTLIATAVTSDTNVRGNESLIGTNRHSTNFELYDAILKGIGMVYVVHDESSSSIVPYTHRYHNIRMEYSADDTRNGMCLGGGTGCYGNVELDGCYFKTTSTQSIDGGFHGHSDYTEIESTFFFTIKNCYFSKRLQLDQIAPLETYEVVYCGNSAMNIPKSRDKVKVTEWNNETHS